MFNIYFHWDEAYTRTKLAIFPEHWAQFIALLPTTRGKIMPTVAEIITENVIKQLEQGVAPWRKPWSTSIPRNLISKRAYRGLNVFMLATQGYGSPYWVTFHQAKQLGAHVRQTYLENDEMRRDDPDRTERCEKGFVLEAASATIAGSIVRLSCC